MNVTIEVRILGEATPYGPDYDALLKKGVLQLCKDIETDPRTGAWEVVVFDNDRDSEVIAEYGHDEVVIS